MKALHTKACTFFLPRTPRQKRSVHLLQYFLKEANIPQMEKVTCLFIQERMEKDGLLAKKMMIEWRFLSVEKFMEEEKRVLVEGRMEEKEGTALQFFQRFVAGDSKIRRTGAPRAIR